MFLSSTYLNRTVIYYILLSIFLYTNYRLHVQVCEMSYMLSNIFSCLFSKGFGEAETPFDDDGKVQDASGTGLGEGEGVNDVSDQIEDEGQIIGDNDKVYLYFLVLLEFHPPPYNIDLKCLLPISFN